MENAVGPAASGVASLLNLFAGARAGEATAGAALATTLSEVPFANVWFAKPAADYLFLNSLREWASPGWLARRDLRRSRDFGQDALVAPSDRMAFDLF